MDTFEVVNVLWLQIMRKSALLLLLILPVMVLSCKWLPNKKKSPTSVPISHWVEVKRLNNDSTIRPFKDTIRVEFQRKNNYVWTKANGIQYKKTYTLVGKELAFGPFSLILVSRKPGKLILREDSIIHYFITDTSKVIKDTTKYKNGHVVETYLPVGSINQMVGHWSIYKRTSPQQGEVDYNKLIKMVDITAGSSDKKLGYIYATLDPPGSPSWAIDTYTSDQILQCSGKDKRNLRVLKCANQELVLEEDGITYYFKAFK